MTVEVIRFPKNITAVSGRRQADSRYDGWYLAANGALFPPASRLAEVPQVRPAGGQARGVAVYVNGELSDVRMTSRSLQVIADATGLGLVGLYNASKCGAQIGANCCAIRTLAGLVVDEVTAERPVHLLAHGQGALVVSAALAEARVTLLKRGATPPVVDLQLSLATIETFGAACTCYPDGPRYVHYVNLADPVTRALPRVRSALSSVVDRFRPFSAASDRPGYGATVRTFRDRPPAIASDESPAHALPVYLRHRLAT